MYGAKSGNASKFAFSFRKVKWRANARNRLQTKAGKAPEHRSCSDRGGGVHAVRVNEIGRDALHDNDDARSKDRGPEIRQDPVGVRMNRPAIAEKAYRDQ